MEQTLLGFINTLRQHDVRISTSETLDALQTADVIGYSNQQLLRDALAASLTKTRDEKALFHQCFDLYFLAKGERHSEQQQTKTESPHPSQFELPDAVAGDAAVQNALSAPMVQAALEGNNDAVAMAIEEAAEGISLDNVRFNTQKGIFRRRLAEAAGTGQFDRAIDALKAIDSEELAGPIEWLEQQRYVLDMAARDAVEHQLLLNANAAGRAIQQQMLRNTRLSALEHYHLKQLPTLIRALAKKLATRHRQRRRVDRRGKLDMAKTLRRNLAYGGVPFHTYWKQKRKDQPKLVVLCDVSGSVSTYARFLLLFLYSLTDVMPRIRSFVFTSETYEVTDLFERHPPEQAVELVNQKWGRGSSDYGNSFKQFVSEYSAQIDRNTTLIILGDGRANSADPGLDQLRELYQRSKYLLWFNPEPRASWNTGDSEIKRYQSACHFVAECNSMAKLERLLDRLLTVLH
ncbi:VWA domain-containing protein [Litorivivens sp.]|uniref:vWA domain-containing protein n=2 Tax=Litorivivens sp. TaxID=2020868 RepID=UPI0035671710